MNDAKREPQDQLIEQLQQENSELRLRVASLEEHVAQMAETICLLRKALYGSSSEKSGTRKKKRK